MRNPSVVGGLSSFVYDYFEKDHLGNVRMVLTEQQDTSFYPAATMETAQETTEEALYANLPETRTAISSIAGYPNWRRYAAKIKWRWRICAIQSSRQRW